MSDCIVLSHFDSSSQAFLPTERLFHYLPSGVNCGFSGFRCSPFSFVRYLVSFVYKRLVTCVHRYSHPARSSCLISLF